MGQNLQKRGNFQKEVEPIKIYVGGTFDMFHSGHIKLLKRAKNLIQGAHVIVAVNTDEFAASYKRKPVMPLMERVAVVEACRYVDEVLVNEGGADSKPSIVKVHPQFILHGSDWTGEQLLNQMGLTQQWLDNQEIKMLYLPYTEGISTTKLYESFRTDTNN